MNRLILSSLALLCASSALAAVAQCPSQPNPDLLQSSSYTFNTSKNEIATIKAAHDIQLHFVYIDNGGIAHCDYTSDHGLIYVNLNKQYAEASPVKPQSMMHGLSSALGSWNSQNSCSSTGVNSCQFNIQA